MSSKQAKRAAQKSASKKDVEEEPVSSTGTVSPGKLLEVTKTLLMGSCIVKYAPKIPHILQAEGPLSGGVKQGETKATEEKTEENEEKTVETEPAKGVEKEETVEIFETLVSRLAWHNPLGLAGTAADSMTMWYSLKGQELDMGPLKKKKGTPKMDRILQNLCNNLSQYLHILLTFMMLQAFLFRSFFSCLPWLVGYQFASMLVPLKTMEKLPQVPLSQVPLKFRVAGTMAIHALVWLFFAYEVIWKCNFIIEFLALGLIIFHAHSAAPGSN